MKKTKRSGYETNNCKLSAEILPYGTEGLRMKKPS